MGAYHSMYIAVEFIIVSISKNMKSESQGMKIIVFVGCGSVCIRAMFCRVNYFHTFRTAFEPYAALRKSLGAYSMQRSFCLPNSLMYPCLICSEQAEGSLRDGRGSSASRVSTHRASRAGRCCLACARGQWRNSSKPSSTARSAACRRHFSVITPLYSFALYVYDAYIL